MVGVKVEGPDGAQELRAKAVVLATGGFGGSAEYCDQLVPAINEMGFQYLGNAMNTGDGMTMASAIGAALYEDPDVYKRQVCGRLASASSWAPSAWAP